MAEQPTTEHPYTEADVRLVIDAVNATALRDWETWPTIAAQDDALARAALDALAAAGRLLPEGAKVDALTDGTHRYWSTHCRHNRHDDCSASTMTRHRVAGGPLEAVPRPVEVHKAPAQCKTCASPCICPCHAPAPVNEESTDG